MLHLLLGVCGSGKTACLTEAICRDTAAGKTVFLLVPEQEALGAEAAMTALLPPSAQLTFEVVNFTRLANRVFRRYGGLSYKYLTGGMKACLMWRALRACGSLSAWHGDTADEAFVSMMLAAGEELKRGGATPEQLQTAAAALEDTPRLSAKLRDLSQVCSVYEGLLADGLADPSDDIGRLAALLEEHDFFAGSRVYVDSFSDFTYSEMAVLGHIAAQAEELTVTVACDGGGLSERAGASPQYRKLYHTAAALRAAARRRGVPFDERLLEGNRRAQNDELRHLTEYLFADGAPSFPDRPEHLRLFACADSYDEAERIAADICRRVREDGLRYRDFAVVAREAEAYAGVIDAVFSKYDIPCFLSRPSDVLSKPLSKMILCALAVLRFGWRREDVMTYLRSGLAGVSDEECDELSVYCEKWNVTGKGFSGELSWSMNPDGLREEFTPRAAELLARLCDVRERLRAPLLALGEVFSGGRPTVRRVCRALFEFLTERQVPQTLSAMIAADRAAGRLTEAEESAQLWNVTLDALDRLTLTAGEETVTIAEFSSLFSMLLSETKLGALPPSADAVTIGSASALRTAGIRAAYLVGCERGVFPAAVNESSVFADAEKIALEGEGIFLSPRSEVRLSEELFYFLRAASLAADELTLSYRVGSFSGEGGQPSAPLLRIMRLFPELEARRETDPAARLYCREAMRDALPAHVGDALGAAIRRVLPSDPAILTAADAYPLVLGDCSVTPELARELFPDELRLTQSRLEEFIRCRFSYYCSYVLGIDPGRDVFDYADIGSFMHRILELALTSQEPLDRLIDDYMRRVCPREKLASARVTELFGRLRRTASLLLTELREEFAQSDFKPAFYEYKIGMGETPALTFPLPDGGTVSLSGIADRIDTYMRDGRAYVRIVDYKTGKKSFSLSDVAEGINLQLLIYLFSVWKSPSRDFLARTGAGEVLPAGILYFEARDPELSLECTDETEGLDERERREVKRSGLFLDDDGILRAMDRELSGRYLPVKLKKDGGFAAGASVASLARFGELYREVGDTIARIGTEMKSGAADANPKTEFLNTKNKPRCAYCPMHPVCRHDRKS